MGVWVATAVPRLQSGGPPNYHGGMGLGRAWWFPDKIRRKKSKARGRNYDLVAPNNYGCFMILGPMPEFHLLALFTFWVFFYFKPGSFAHKVFFFLILGLTICFLICGEYAPPFFGILGPGS